MFTYFPMFTFPGGSDGGHKGLKSVIACLGHERFARLRVGVGPAPSEEHANFVLSPFARDEKPVIEEATLRAAQAATVMRNEVFGLYGGHSMGMETGYYHLVPLFEEELGNPPPHLAGAADYGCGHLAFHGICFTSPWGMTPES